MFQHLVIGGGASRTISVIGALRFLEEQKHLQHIKTFIGTSAGSILSFLLALRYSVDEIHTHIVEDFFRKDVHVLSMDQLMTLDAIRTFGLDSGDKFVAFLRQMLFNKLKVTSISFMDLAKKTGNHLVVCVANLTAMRSEYMSVETQPDMDVVKALRMSIAIPFIFTPVSHEDCLFVDGGIYEAFPIRYLNKYTDPLKDTVAINTPVKNTCLQKRPTSFLEYTLCLLHSIIDKANEMDKKSDKLHIIDIEFDEGNLAGISFEKMTFELSIDAISKMESMGYDAIKRYFVERMPSALPLCDRR